MCWNQTEVVRGSDPWPARVTFGSIDNVIHSTPLHCSHLRQPAPTVNPPGLHTHPPTCITCHSIYLLDEIQWRYPISNIHNLPERFRTLIYGRERFYCFEYYFCARLLLCASKDDESYELLFVGDYRKTKFLNLRSSFQDSASTVILFFVFPLYACQKYERL